MANDHPLTSWRDGQSLSQEEAAVALGVTRWTINSIETGRRKPSMGLVKAIETKTGIPREALRPDIFGPAKPAKAGQAA